MESYFVHNFDQFGFDQERESLRFEAWFAGIDSWIHDLRGSCIVADGQEDVTVVIEAQQEKEKREPMLAGDQRAD